MRESKHIQDLSALVMPDQQILVLAPHPDDFDAIAVSLHECHRRNCHLKVAVLTGGASGVLDDFCGPDHARKVIARQGEQRDSLRFFGLPEDGIQFLRLPEDEHGNLIEGTATEAAIDDLLSAVAPNVVFLPHGNDTNPSHQRTWNIFRRLAEEGDRSMLGAYSRDPKTREMRVDAFVAFGEPEAEWKGQLLRLHASQQHRNFARRGRGFDERILDVNRAIAQELGLASSYAEAFEVELFHPRPADPPTEHKCHTPQRRRLK